MVLVYGGSAGSGYLYLFQIFRASPLMGLALCMFLGTIFWCLLLTRRQNNGLDKILTGLLGLICVYEALRVLKDSGILLFPGIARLDGWVDFLVASIYLMATLILKLSSTDRASTKVRLRLVEANEKTVDVGKNAPSPELTQALFDTSPLATFAVDTNGIVIYWNAAAERLLEWKREEVLGQRLPFGSGQLLNKRQIEIEGAVWTSAIRTANGPTRGTLTIVADSSALRAAGIVSGFPSKAQLALNH